MRRNKRPLIKADYHPNQDIKLLSHVHAVIDGQLTANTNYVFSNAGAVQGKFALLLIPPHRYTVSVPEWATWAKIGDGAPAYSPQHHAINGEAFELPNFCTQIELDIFTDSPVDMTVLFSDTPLDDSPPVMYGTMIGSVTGMMYDSAVRDRLTHAPAFDLPAKLVPFAHTAALFQPVMAVASDMMWGFRSGWNRLLENTPTTPADSDGVVLGQTMFPRRVYNRYTNSEWNRCKFTMNFTGLMKGGSEVVLGSVSEGVACDSKVVGLTPAGWTSKQVGLIEAQTGLHSPALAEWYLDTGLPLSSIDNDSIYTDSTVDYPAYMDSQGFSRVCSDTKPLYTVNFFNPQSGDHQIYVHRGYQNPYAHGQIGTVGIELLISTHPHRDSDKYPYADGFGYKPKEVQEHVFTHKLGTGVRYAGAFPKVTSSGAFTMSMAVDVKSIAPGIVLPVDIAQVNGATFSGTSVPTTGGSGGSGTGTGSPTGSASNPFHVIVDNTGALSVNIAEVGGAAISSTNPVPVSGSGSGSGSGGVSSTVTLDDISTVALDKLRTVISQGISVYAAGLYTSPPLSVPMSVAIGNLTFPANLPAQITPIVSASATMTQFVTIVP